MTAFDNLYVSTQLMASVLRGLYVIILVQNNYELTKIINRVLINDVI